MKIKIFVWLLPLCVLFFLNKTFSQSSTLSFTSIPSTTEIPSPGRGAEQWHYDDPNLIIGNVAEGVTPVMMDAYVRSSLTWDKMETSQGAYNWTSFDGAMNDAISKGRKLSFSIMALFPGYNGGVTANGVGMAYPLYLHNLMQAEGGNNTDWISPQNPSWVPNYNSANWQARVSALLNALAAHINSASFNGKNYKDALGVVSIGLMGAWAEWNFSNLVGNVATEFPAGRIPTFAAGKALIDAYINAFPNNPLVIPHAAFDHQQLQNVWTDPQTGWYALTATNKWGKIGITRMNWGLTESYISAWAENNTFTYNGLRFDTAIMNRYKYAPLTGEVAGYNAAVGGAPFWDLPRQVTFYHASSFGNGNYYGEQNISLQGRDNIRAAWRASGYRLVLETGTITSTLSGGMPFSVSLNWKNLGVAPAYENWNVTYELRNASNVAVWSGTSSFTPKLFLPSATATTVTDNFTLPASVAQGTYNMVLIVRDPSGYRQPLPLAINGRNTDGSYLLKNINVGASSGVQPPVANAGTAQTVTMPVTTIAVQGSGTAAAGQTISSYSWSMVTGPNVPTLSGTSSPALTIAGTSVVAGNYTCRLTVTQSNTATATSDVTITVKPAVTGPSSPVTPAVATTIFTAQTPANPLYNDGQGIELGVKFRSSTTGNVTGVRFYKIAGDGGTHTGELYSSAGTRLAQAVFSAESTSGWQQVLFSTPIAVTAGTTYIAAYHSSAGNYAATNNFFTADIVNGVIAGLADGKDGVNGLYNYSSTPIFPTTSNGQKPNYWVDVLFTAGSVVTPTPPATVTANAGSNQTITLPTATVTLDGSKSTGTISSYTWTKVSGPGTPVIAGASAVVATDTVNLVLIQGESNAAGMAYNTQATSLELSPRNNVKIINNNTLQFESLQLGVNNNIKENVGAQTTHGFENGLADAIDAGKLTQPTYLVKAGGSGSWISEWLSTGTSRNAGEYSWAQMIGRMDAAVNYLKSKGIPYKITVWQSIGINDYNAGTTNATYQSQMQQFRTDLRSRYGQNIPFLTTHFFPSHPYNAVIDAIAASDPYGISSAIDVSGATYKDPNVHWDHDGLILIANRMIGKMATSTSATPPSTSATSVVTGLVQGVYVFQLAVNGGASTSQVTVTVNPVATAAVANAGANQTITLPTSAVTLNGTGSTGAISSYAWTKVSGPNTPALAAATASSTAVSGLIQGVYVFQLSINGGASTSKVAVSINAAAVAVSANAGTNQTITLPTSAVTLNGTGSTGTISSYAWTKVSGPNTPALSAATASSTAVSGLVQGVYVFQLSVNAGASVSQVTVTVNPSGVTANAGINQVIILPASSVTLSGSTSTGVITSYAWTKVSGPNTPTISSPSSATTAVRSLVQGTYVFQLSVNGGASVSQVTVSVNAAVVATTIFTTQKPVNLYMDGKGVELGVKFRSSTAGYVTGIRFYKMSGDGGTHTGELYSSTGTRLAQAVFTAEGASGWQQVLFSTPVAVSAGTTYVAAYHSSAGSYAATNNFYTANVVNGVLTGLADGVDGVNGVYNYSSSPVFPSISNGQKPNYWVDVLFVANTSTALAAVSSGNAVINEAQADVSGTVKNNYQLDQNYPNPASQTTRINYYIAETGRVELILTDVMGIQTRLVSEVQTAGAHSYTLNVNSLRKGIYFYKIQAGKFTATKSLIVQ